MNDDKTEIQIQSDLNKRVSSVEVEISVLSSNMQHLSSDISSISKQISIVSEKITQNQQPKWQNYLSFAAILLVIFGMVGSLYSRDMSNVETAIGKHFDTILELSIQQARIEERIKNLHDK